VDELSFFLKKVQFKDIPSDIWKVRKIKDNEYHLGVEWGHLDAYPYLFMISFDLQNHVFTFHLKYNVAQSSNVFDDVVSSVISFVQNEEKYLLFFHKEQFYPSNQTSRKSLDLFLSIKDCLKHIDFHYWMNENKIYLFSKLFDDALSFVSFNQDGTLTVDNKVFSKKDEIIRYFSDLKKLLETIEYHKNEIIHFAKSLDANTSYRNDYLLFLNKPVVFQLKYKQDLEYGYGLIATSYFSDFSIWDQDLSLVVQKTKDAIENFYYKNRISLLFD
jgi:hypothetical protein